MRHGYARETVRYNSDYDAAQLTGAATTYAIKRAYEALFSLSDDNDPDAALPPMTIEEARNTPIEYTDVFLEKHQGKVVNGEKAVGCLDNKELLKCSSAPYVLERTRTACVVLLNAQNNGEVNGSI